MLEKGFTVPVLAEPALPPSSSWFPLPPGWLVLGSLLLVALLIWLFFRTARWRRNRWRRDALFTLSSSQPVDSWLVLIKQVLLVHHPRETISHSLTAGSILQYVPLDATLHAAMCAKYCQRDNRLDAAEETRLRQQLTQWLKELPDV
ncbi:DUF4381 family protein [Enterobacteriaceae bacterium RIT691]|nr:DUF4381 family protein [Enterobacteriaceae bacterium RIT691]